MRSDLLEAKQRMEEELARIEGDIEVGDHE
jgi:hypothetical protein